ncbi:hypothetical protein Kpol_1010p18 [Vanderwaltozyma polyspora DSM 70294]|uniref:Uncharacterized protein n=1 Tax=Vanderwaltozyma polyspora (strain ATCC 22028 / DSM 70294 / BCRC 21397 / CBS 2163 / NBRC 10782 / NRRL Y-8283 / UCD 57-17) TaxID=436907 RepID=A7TIG5_VANPO|nr:uncharacterized protein Kpol_1010p18 [Vanderwaltozyma polyspora DSM 70294]EDO17903.1 hypothetical protein Kpol_1010p18 [Vanderwaltozyma polyspora DSM 70294]
MMSARDRGTMSGRSRVLSSGFDENLWDFDDIDTIVKAMELLGDGNDTKVVKSIPSDEINDVADNADVSLEVIDEKNNLSAASIFAKLPILTNTPLIKFNETSDNQSSPSDFDDIVTRIQKLGDDDINNFPVIKKGFYSSPWKNNDNNDRSIDSATLATNYNINIRSNERKISPAYSTNSEFSGNLRSETPCSVVSADVVDHHHQPHHQKKLEPPLQLPTQTQKLGALSKRKYKLINFTESGGDILLPKPELETIPVSGKDLDSKGQTKNEVVLGNPKIEINQSLKLRSRPKPPPSFQLHVNNPDIKDP